MSKYIREVDLLDACVEVEYLGHPRMMISAAKISQLPSIDIVRCKCDFGKCHEQGDTLYESSDWDGGIGFDYIRDIKYCPLCGGLLDGEEQTEREGE